MLKCILKRIVACTVTVCIALSSALLGLAEESRFPDMSGHWAQNYVDALAKQGIISGMADGLFYPNSLVTTGQFVSMLLVGRFGKMAPVNEYWASGYIDYAYNIGIINEYDVSFAQEPLERRNAARIGHDMLVKVLGEADEIDWTAAKRLADLYSCKTCVIHIAQMFTKGIIIGRPDGLFHGEDNITRAESAIIITRMLDPTFRIPQTAAMTVSPTYEDRTILPDVAMSIIESDKTTLLIDVRSQEEHNAGYIPKSICVPLSEIAEEPETVIPLDKGTTIIVYCQKGSRSLEALNILMKAGYTNVYNIGGIDDWPYEIITAEN